MTRFQTVREALQFLAERLESGRFDEIADACSDSVRRASLIRAVEALAERHQANDIRLTYADSVFPSDRDKFKLGGHSSAIGHLHIDFARADDGWALVYIWICR